MSEPAEVTRLREKIARLEADRVAYLAEHPQRNLTHTLVQRLSGCLDPFYYPVCARCASKDPGRYIPASDTDRTHDWEQDRWCVICQFDPQFHVTYRIDSDLRIAKEDLLDELCTVECAACEGSGGEYDWGERSTCFHCSGRGRRLPEGVLDPTDY